MKARKVQKTQPSRVMSHFIKNKTSCQLFTRIGTCCISENQKYILNDKYKTILGVRKGTEPPVPASFFKKVQSGIEYNGNQYDVFESNINLNTTSGNSMPNDCGLYASALSHSRTMSSWSQYLNMYDKNSFRRLFAELHDYNLCNVGKKARPNIGEAYFIWPSNPNDPMRIDKRCNHHVATVVAVDESDRITSEADAGDPYRKKPYFEIYGTEQNTFYDRYFRNFSSYRTLVHNDQLPRVAELSSSSFSL